MQMCPSVSRGRRLGKIDGEIRHISSIVRDIDVRVTRKDHSASKATVTIHHGPRLFGIARTGSSVFQSPEVIASEPSQVVVSTVQGCSRAVGTSEEIYPCQAGLRPQPPLHNHNELTSFPNAEAKGRPIALRIVGSSTRDKRGIQHCPSAFYAKRRLTEDEGSGLIGWGRLSEQRFSTLAGRQNLCSFHRPILDGPHPGATHPRSSECAFPEWKDTNWTFDLGTHYGSWRQARDTMGGV